MSEFLKSYGSWIVFGLLLLLMMWMHTRGHGGCSTGHEQEDARNPETTKDKDRSKGDNSPSYH
ncbi:MAG: hypothetical protein HY667_05810 [Chloroflexi bacterium]|nr:hypothetical protein [Chloroflexota bacterium]